MLYAEATGGATLDTFRVIAAKIAVNNAAFERENSVEGTPLQPFFMIPEECTCRFLVVLFSLFLEAKHFLALPAYDRFVNTVTQISRLNLNGRSFTLNHPCMEQRTGDFAKQASGAGHVIYFNSHRLPLSGALSV